MVTIAFKYGYIYFWNVNRKEVYFFYRPHLLCYTLSSTHVHLTGRKPQSVLFSTLSLFFCPLNQIHCRHIPLAGPRCYNARRDFHPINISERLALSRNDTVAWNEVFFSTDKARLQLRSQFHPHPYTIIFDARKGSLSNFSQAIFFHSSKVGFESSLKTSWRKARKWVGRSMKSDPMTNGRRWYFLPPRTKAARSGRSSVSNASAKVFSSSLSSA